MRNSHFPILCLILLMCSWSCTPPDADRLRFSGWQSSPSEERLMRETLQSFREEYPGFEFNYEPIPGNYTEKMQLMLGTKTAPDVFYLKAMTAPSYIKFDVLEPLDSYLGNDTSFEKEDYFPALLSAFEEDGVQYGIPKDFNPYVLFYNPELFAKSGIEHTPQNWQELEELAGQLTKDLDGDGKVDQYGLVIEPSIEMLMIFVYQNGGSFQKASGELGITEPAFIEALQFYYGLYEKGIASIPTDVGVGWNGDAFGRGKAAMVFSGGWLIPFLEDNYPRLQYGVDFLPAGKERSTIAFTTAYVMPKASRNKEDAWILMSYLSSTDAMAKASEGFALPSRKSAVKQLKLDQDSVFGTFIRSAEFARPFQVSYLERWYNDSNSMLQSIFFTGKDPEEALKELELSLTKYRL